MSKISIQAIVLAAGKSTRFNTETTKLLHKICGQEMILYPIKLLDTLKISTSLIVGCQSQKIEECVQHNTQQPKQFIKQTQQHGTGHAILCSKKIWKKDHILVINGDMPLITETILKQLIDTHIQTNTDLTFVTSHNSNPSQHYGRIIENDNSIRIVEARHFKGNSNKHCCINAGIYLFKKCFLEKTISQLAIHAESNEYYITDLVKIASEKKYTVKTINVPFDSIRGVNTMKELWAVEHIKRSDLISFWMNQGVRFNSAHTVQIDIDIAIGSETTIGCGVNIIKGTIIGKNCLIDSFATLDKVHLGNNVHIKQNSLLYNSYIGDGSQIGPFANIQENTHIEKNSIIGNFVEVRRTTIGNNTKIKHLSYIGDATIGNSVNIGAGTIICNYDGKKKQKTIIKDNVFIGSNSTLVAPITIEKGALTVEGSIITDNVPSQTLALGRARQATKKNYVEKKENEKNKKNTHSFSGAFKSDNHSISHDT